MRPFVIHDRRFGSLVIGHTLLEKLWTGCRWAEGPAYFPAGRYLVWSDIPNDRIMRFDETDGSVSVFREPCFNANGNTTDAQGRLVTAEHRGRRITRTEHNSAIMVLADRFEGKRLNSPNDVVVKSDGSVWFTDPTYGIDSDYEGDKAESEIGASNVYRIDPKSGAVTAVVRDRVRPNGLAFSPDEKILYVADTGRSHVPDLPATLTAYTVNSDGAVGRRVQSCLRLARKACSTASVATPRATSGLRRGATCFAMRAMARTSVRFRCRSWLPTSASAVRSVTGFTSAARPRCTRCIQRQEGRGFSDAKNHFRRGRQL